MVEAKNAQISEEFNKMVQESINDEFKKLIEKKSCQTEQYEELKVKIKPKIFVAERALADVAKILSAFQNQHQADGRPVFTKSIEFYLKALKFESQ